MKDGYLFFCSQELTPYQELHTRYLQQKRGGLASINQMHWNDLVLIYHHNYIPCDH